MARLLYIQASPRDRRSRSIRVADAFVAAYVKTHPDDEVTTIDLFRKELPVFDGAVLNARYVLLHGKSHTPEQAATWQVVVDVINEFTAADKYLFAVPMWNFGIPYRLKQYIDILVQPTYTFRSTPEAGYEGLVKGKPCAIAFARGGNYEKADLTAIDYQKRYMEFILGYIGITDVRSVIAQPMLMDGPEVADKKMAAAIAEAEKMAAEF